MRRFLMVLSLFLIAPLNAPMTRAAAPPANPPEWQTKLTESMPLLGHRNWILIVDSAYPLQAASGIETIETNASQLDVLRHVLGAIDRSIHVRPVISMDAELAFLSEEDAPGVSTYRSEINDLLRGYPVESLAHDRVIANIEEASKHFNILVLKTNMTVPYTSVFIRLDCKYWSDDAEKRLRARIAADAKATH